jgi:hypothetical protein
MLLTDTEQAVYNVELYDLALSALEDFGVTERNAYIFLDYYEHNVSLDVLSIENELSKTRVSQIRDKMNCLVRGRLKRIGEIE